jgi:exodeoxyribonuclease V alpha subunit
MMRTLTDVHQMFAEFFPEKAIRPYAYLLSKRLEEGHVCIPLSEPTEMAAELPGDLIKDLADPVKLRLLERLVGQPGSVVPFILDDDRLYLQRYHAYETRVVTRIKEMIAAGRQLHGERMRRLKEISATILDLPVFPPIPGLSVAERIDWHLVAAIQALLNDFFIITGGPGTGKTTTLAKLLRILFAMDENTKVALAAPTGKAAMRMLESLKANAGRYPVEFQERIAALQPSTIHKLLGSRKGSIYFKHGKEHPLSADLVIIDEASMVDMPLFAKLLDAIKPGGRLILLGDKDQLASVEAGSLFGDLCQSLDGHELNRLSPEEIGLVNGFMTDPVKHVTPEYLNKGKAMLSGHITELKLSHRFREQKAIGEVSLAIIRGDADALAGMIATPPEDGLSFDTEYDKNVLSDFVRGYRKYIEEPDPMKALKLLNDLRVLVAVREGPDGLHTVNKAIEQELQKAGLIHPDKAFYENRPVIITANNYELNLFNGDIGIVRKKNGSLRVWFEGEEGRPRDILPAFLDRVETVYAMTIHKSQGSEFDQVMVILPKDKDHPLLTRELLYTAVTRARKRVVIRAGQETLENCARRMVKRISGIRKRINATVPGEVREKA